MAQQSPMPWLAMAMALLSNWPTSLAAFKQFSLSRTAANQYLSVSHWSASGTTVTRVLCSYWCQNDATCKAFAFYDARADPMSATGLNMCKLSSNASSTVTTMNLGWTVYKLAVAGMKGRDLGCMRDADPRLLPDGVWVNSTHVTPATCVDYCARFGFAYAGVQAHEQCFCGADFNLPPETMATNTCQLPCHANPSLFCGGYWVMGVFETGIPG